jgi:mannitol-specific phosphotransferase system IIBC component
MKQKDIATIAVVAIVAAVISLLVTQTIFVSKKSRELTAETVEPINATFNQPDKTVFNQNAINPTQLIQIGDSTRSTPF